MTIFIRNTLRAARHPRAFTLIELLVVIAIVVVLMGILLPALGNSRRTARQAVCLSNLRQWAAATRIYADTYDGYLPRRGQGVNATQQINRPADWFNACPAVLGQACYMDLAAANKVPRPNTQSFFSCPEAIDNGQPNFWSYAMNMWLSVYNNSAADLPDKFNAVGEPATMVLFTDGPAAHCSVSPADSTVDYSPVPRHNNRVNIAFLDGHIDSPLGSYVGCNIGFIEHPDIRWRVPNSQWASAQH